MSILERVSWQRLAAEGAYGSPSSFTGQHFSSGAGIAMTPLSPWVDIKRINTEGNIIALQY